MTRKRWTVAGAGAVVAIVAAALTAWLAAPGLRAESDTTAAGEPGVSLGVVAVPVSGAAARFLGVPAGLRVIDVAAGGPSDGSLIRGDTLTAIDGVALTQSTDLASALLGRAPGAAVTLSVTRGGAPLQVEVTLAEPVPGDERPAGLAALQDAFDRALSGELVFEGRDGGPRKLAFVTGTVASVDAEGISLAPVDGSPALSYPLSPNVWIWKDGAPLPPGPQPELAGLRAKVVSVDGTAEAIVAGGLFPPAFEALQGLLEEGQGFGGLSALAEAFAGASTGTDTAP